SCHLRGHQPSRGHQACRPRLIANGRHRDRYRTLPASARRTSRPSVSARLAVLLVALVVRRGKHAQQRRKLVFVMLGATPCVGTKEPHDVGAVEGNTPAFLVLT